MKIKKLLPKKFKGWIKTNFQLFNVNFLNNKNVSFSQAGEDFNLRNIFEGKKKGFYVDIGAFHPLILSNTCYFYQFDSWTGINIDARPGSKKLFDKHRPKDINLELAVSFEETDLTYYFIDETSSMNSFSKDFLENKSIDGMKQVKKEIQIPAKPLSWILDKYLPKGTDIDFMNIDVEGMDLEVLSSNDWKKYRPRAIVIEVSAETFEDILNNPVTLFLKELYYKPCAITYLASSLKNVIFINDKS